LPAAASCRLAYADLTIGLVDASVIALAERLRESKVATLAQRHFRALRPAHVEALELLPEEEVLSPSARRG
jgi:hypothetical protein